MSKLQGAEQELDALSEETQTKRALLEQKQREAEESLNKITSLMSLAADRKRKVQNLTQKLQTEEVTFIGDPLDTFSRTQ